MSATQTITCDGPATLDAIRFHASPKLTAHADAVDERIGRNDRSARNERGDTFALSPADRQRLTRWTRAATSPRRVVTRSLVVLLAASGSSNVAIAARLGVTRATVALWKARFLDGGPEALLNDAPGRGRKPGRDPQLVARILHATAQHPPHGARSTLRDIARRANTSRATVQRVLREHGLDAAPHAPARSTAGSRSSRDAHPRIDASVQDPQASDNVAPRMPRVPRDAHARIDAFTHDAHDAQAISETSRRSTTHPVMAAALPLSDASPRVIAIRHQRDGLRSRRSTFRKVTA